MQKKQIDYEKGAAKIVKAMPKKAQEARANAPAAQQDFRYGKTGYPQGRTAAQQAAFEKKKVKPIKMPASAKRMTSNGYLAQGNPTAADENIE